MPANMWKAERLLVFAESKYGRSQHISPQMDTNLIQRYPLQDVAGPIQADEAMLLFAIVRVTNTCRILELGGLDGFSAQVFLDALEAKGSNAKLYTVDLVEVKSQDGGRRHKTIHKDAAELTMQDIDDEAIDLLFLDCHCYYATKTTVENMLKFNMLSENALIVLHDTGKHLYSKDLGWNRDGIHQPAERLIARWLSGTQKWQRISFHDDHRNPFRHGVTVMQRKVDLSIPADTNWPKGSWLGEQAKVDEIKSVQQNDL